MALTRMQQRRGTASQWAAENPTLGSGEIGFETDNNRFKIGDGVTDWATLQYFSNKEDVDAAIASAISDVIDLAPETLDTLNEIAAAINDDPDFFNTIATNIGTKVSKAGDTMTGDLTLPNDPTQNLHAATKQYVDQAETDANTYTDGEISSLIASGETTTPGGVEGQVLAKASDDDFDTEWVTPTGLLGDLADVQTYEVVDKDTLVYDEDLGLWLPGPGGGRFNVAETPPTEPLNGDTWLDSVTGNTYLYYEDLDSPQWIQIGGPGIASARGASLFIQTTAPANPVEGDIWYDSAEGFTYLYYVDADSSQWIQFGLNRNGANGANGSDGTNGVDGEDGVGIPVGGSQGQIIIKASLTDYDVQWTDPESALSSTTLNFNNWESTTSESVASFANNTVDFGSNSIVGNFKNDFASFGSTTAITISNTTPVKTAFDRALYASTDMSWAFATDNGTIPPYNWKHSKTGFYQLSYWVRTTNDVWNVLSVCKNNSFANAVGTSARSGSQNGQFGYAGQLIYKVDNVDDTFALFHWSQSPSSTMSSFSGTPPAGFIATPQDGGAAPANGYFVTFNITPVSSL